MKEQYTTLSNIKKAYQTFQQNEPHSPKVKIIYNIFNILLIGKISIGYNNTRTNKKKMNMTIKR